MARPATGSVRYEGGRWKARVTQPDGSRPLIPIEPPLTRKSDKAVAIAAARHMSSLARDPAVFAPASEGEDELTQDWFDRWLAAKEAKGQSSVRAARSHLANHILPVFGTTPMSRVSKAQLETIVQNLDKKIATGDLRWKSALNVWGTCTKAFDDAHRGKNLELRCRDDNPAKDVRGPDRGVETEQVHLYPKEFAALVSSRAVPIFRRRYYAIAVYCYLRPGELEALRWDDIDLARKTIQVRHGVDRITGEDKAPKAKRARAPFSIEPALLPLLKAMFKESGGEGYVVGRLGDERKLAEILRADLLAVGVTRKELHECCDDPPREWMVMHGCRHTGVTWMAVRGDEPLMIMARAGHQDLKTTLGYVNRAALIRRGYGRPFPPLPAALVTVRRDYAEGAESSGRRFGREFSDTLEIPPHLAEAHGNRTHRPPREGRAHPF